MFERNLSAADRMFRAVISIIFIYFGFFEADLIGDYFLAYLLGAIGILNLVPAIIAICPVYSLAEISTRRRSD